MSNIRRKLVFFIIMYLVWPNILYLTIIPTIFGNPLYVALITISYMLGLADTLLRPITKERNDSKKFSALILLLFILNPVFIIIAVFEKTILILPMLPAWNSLIISYIGMVLFTGGGLITTISRAQLGKFASGDIVIQEEHELYTDDIYGYVRNPIYTGAIVGAFGMLLIFNSIITLLAVTILYFFIFRGRILEEEMILQAQFGDKFLEYCMKTKRLFPGIY